MAEKQEDKPFTIDDAEAYIADLLARVEALEARFNDHEHKVDGSIVYRG